MLPLLPSRNALIYIVYDLKPDLVDPSRKMLSNASMSWCAFLFNSQSRFGIFLPYRNPLLMINWELWKSELEGWNILYNTPSFSDWIHHKHLIMCTLYPLIMLTVVLLIYHNTFYYYSRADNRIRKRSIIMRKWWIQTFIKWPNRALFWKSLLIACICIDDDTG